MPYFKKSTNTLTQNQKVVGTQSQLNTKIQKLRQTIGNEYHSAKKKHPKALGWG